MIRYLAAGLLLWSWVAIAKPTATVIDLSVAADGSCQARIGDQIFPATEDEIAVRLPKIVPNRKSPLRFGAGAYADVPYRCVGGMLFSLQRLGYLSITFTAEPPPLGPDITHPGMPAQ